MKEFDKTRGNIERLPLSDSAREKSLIAKMFPGVDLNDVGEMRTRKTLAPLLQAYFDGGCDMEPDDEDFLYLVEDDD